MVNSLVGKALTVFVMITFLLSTSCTSTRVLKSQPDTLQNELKTGDFVKITTKDGRDFTFRIVDISSEAIIGEKRGQGKEIIGGRRGQRIEILIQ